MTFPKRFMKRSELLELLPKAILDEVQGKPHLGIAQRMSDKKGSAFLFDTELLEDYLKRRGKEQAKERDRKWRDALPW